MRAGERVMKLSVWLNQTRSRVCVFPFTSARHAANGALKINDSLVKLSLELILEMRAHCLLSQY